ncbi:MAG TPA: oligosaccharide flippase family protein [Gemmatimonadaceae bacterium]|nr:oligosaccharide flippase family protein [Gemmatimonadaceae bacterium]
MIPWQRLRQSLLARNAAWLTVGQGGLKVLQATYFVVLARTLGAGGLGAFAAATALSQLIAPMAGLGAGNVLIQHVARRREVFNHYWGGAVTLTLVAGVCSVGAAALVGRAILPSTIATSLVICVATSDLVFATVLFLCGQAYQAQEKMARTAQLPIVTTLLRLVAAIAFVATPGPHTAALWGYYYLACTAGSTTVALLLTSRELGRPVIRFNYTATDVRDGFFFAAGISAQNIYNDIDKVMLGRLVPDLSATGIYSAAYRVIDVLLVPIRSIGQAAYPKFFKHGARGVRSSAKVAQQLLPPAVSYGALAAILMFVVAPLLPHLLGHDYDQAAGAVRWLSLLPVLKSVQFAAADALTGAGYQATRTMLQVIVAGINIGINFPLITHYSWRGAAWSSLICDGLLSISLWALIFYLRRGSVDTEVTPAPAPPEAEPVSPL